MNASVPDQKVPVLMDGSLLIAALAVTAGALLGLVLFFFFGTLQYLVFCALAVPLTSRSMRAYVVARGIETLPWAIAMYMSVALLCVFSWGFVFFTHFGHSGDVGITNFLGASVSFLFLYYAVYVNIPVSISRAVTKIKPFPSAPLMWIGFLLVLELPALRNEPFLVYLFFYGLGIAMLATLTVISYYATYRRAIESYLSGAETSDMSWWLETALLVVSMAGMYVLFYALVGTEYVLTCC